MVLYTRRVKQNNFKTPRGRWSEIQTPEPRLAGSPQCFHKQSTSTISIGVMLMSLLTPQTRTLVVSPQVAAYNEQPPTKLIPSNSWPAHPECSSKCPNSSTGIKFWTKDWRQEVSSFIFYN